jgi:hypothetical protein
MTFKSLKDLKASPDGFYDPYDVLNLWREVNSNGTIKEIRDLKGEIESSGLTNHPLLEFSLKLK